MSLFHKAILSSIFFFILCLSGAKGRFKLAFGNNACHSYKDYPIRFFTDKCFANPDVSSNTSAIIKRSNYDFETYTVVSEDGYISDLFRILPRSNKRNGQPVFVMNGILTSNAVWVWDGNKSLAFFLADEGFDVWLGAYRGTSHTKHQERYRMNQTEYWDFNLDTLVKFDIREQLQLVYKKTGKPIIYIGFSMGSTVGFMFASEYEGEAHQLLKGIIALAPVVYLNNITALKVLVDVVPFIKEPLQLLSNGGLWYRGETLNRLLVHICCMVPKACLKITEILGKDSNQFIPEYLTLVSSHISGISLQILQHYAQIVNSGTLSHKYYEREMNLRLYNSEVPPQYRLENIKMPVLLLHGDKDTFSTAENAQRILAELGSEKKSLIHIPKDRSRGNFTHLDFTVAKDITELLYPEILGFIEKELSTDA